MCAGDYLRCISGIIEQEFAGQFNRYSGTVFVDKLHLKGAGQGRVLWFGLL